MTRIFGVDYAFLSCGDVFTRGLEHAAESLGVAYVHAPWDAPDLSVKMEAFAPDLLFVVHGRRFTQCFPGVKSFGPHTAVWLLDEPYEVDDTAAFSDRFAHVFVNDAASLSRHRNATVLPVCYDPLVHYADEGAPRPHAVGFIGGANRRRDGVLGALARAKLLTYAIGGPWSDPNVVAVCPALNIPASATAQFYRSTQIIVNVFREEHHFNRDGIEATAMNPRIYEALACGALVVSEPRRQIAEVVPSLPTFRSEAECVDVVKHLLAHPDQAESIRRRCVGALYAHTYADRLSTVINVAAAEYAV